MYADACFEPGPKAGEHETVIAELEALATLLSLHPFESYLVDKDVVVFTDNNAVPSALISGRSSNDVLRRVVNKAFVREDRLGLLLWHERVSELFEHC